MDPDRLPRCHDIHEVDGLGGLPPRALQRNEDNVDRLRRHEQRVTGVVEPPVDDVAEVGAVWKVAVGASVLTTDSGDVEARSGERVTCGYGRGVDSGRRADEGANTGSCAPRSRRTSTWSACS